MASDSSTRGWSKMKSKLNPLSYLSATQGDRLLFSAKQAISRSSAVNLLAGNAEHKNDHDTGLIPSVGYPSHPMQPRTINVILFGETGVGKSSVINLAAQKEVAKVSSGVSRCTMQSTSYNISFDDMDFTIFDTIGLEEPHMGVDDYLKVIEKAYELILRLSAVGGIHLLLFCMRGGRITAVTQSNYRLFCECLLGTKVPTALIFTHLEREAEMEDWWRRNESYIKYYGIKSDGHACITAVQDDTPGENLKYKESQRKIRELLRSCALQNEAFLPETHSWFARLGKGLRSFIEKHRNPKRRDVMRVLTRRCKLDPETAKKIADMMERGDTETKDGNAETKDGNTMTKDGDTETKDGNIETKDGSTGTKDGSAKTKDGNAKIKDGNTEMEDGNAKTKDRNAEIRDENAETKNGNAETKNGNAETKDQEEQAENKEAGGRSDQVHGKDENEGVKNTTKAEPEPEGEDRSVPAHEQVARHHTLHSQNDVESQSHTVGPEGKNKPGITDEKVANDPASAISQNGVNIESRIVRQEKDRSGVSSRGVAKDYTSVTSQNDVKAGYHAVRQDGQVNSGLMQGNVAEGRTLITPQNDVQAESRTVRLQGKDKSRHTHEKAPEDRTSVTPQNDDQAESRPVGLQGKDKSRHTHEKVTEDRTSVTPQNDDQAEPRPVGLQGKDESRYVYENVAKDRTSVAPQNDDQTELRTIGLERKDKSRLTDEAKDRTSGTPQNDVKARPRTMGLHGQTQSGFTKEKVAKDHTSTNPQNDVEGKPIPGMWPEHWQSG